MATVVAGFNRDLIYTMRATPERLLRDLEAIAALDARSERNRRFATWTAVVAAVFLIISFNLPALVQTPPGTRSNFWDDFFRQPLRTILFAFFVMVLFVVDEVSKMIAGYLNLATWIAVAIFVGAVIKRILNGRTKLSQSHYKLYVALVRILGRDMARDAEMQVELDLAPPNVKRKQRRTSHVGQWKVVYYHNPCLRLAGRFADGTSFQISLVELVQERSRWKRSSSGKSKYKSKTKVATRVSVKLYPKVRRYGNLKAIQRRARSLLKLPLWMKVKRLETTAETLKLVAVAKVVGCAGREMVAEMLLNLYRMLRFSKAASR